MSLLCLANNFFSAKGLFWFSVKCLSSFLSSWCGESRVSNLPTPQIWLGSSKPSVISNHLLSRVQARSCGGPSPPCHGWSLAVTLWPPVTLSSPYSATTVPPSRDSCPRRTELSASSYGRWTFSGFWALAAIYSDLIFLSFLFLFPLKGVQLNPTFPSPPHRNKCSPVKTVWLPYTDSFPIHLTRWKRNMNSFLVDNKSFEVGIFDFSYCPPSAQYLAWSRAQSGLVKWND